MIAKYAIQYLAFTGVPGVRDDYGNVIESWAAPVDKLVFGVNVPNSGESAGEGHNRVVVDKVLLTPPSFTVSPKDRFRFTLDPGKTYEVVGVAETTEGNPFGWNPGGRIKLVRVDG